MLKKILNELILIRKELQDFNNKLEFPEKVDLNDLSDKLSDEISSSLNKINFHY